MAASVRATKKGDESLPSVIADVIGKAINAKKPKALYAAGKIAKMLLARAP